jgi:hypothetical protein
VVSEEAARAALSVRPAPPVVAPASVPKLQGLVGKALPHIGTYNDLDNKQQVRNNQLKAPLRTRGERKGKGKGKGKEKEKEKTEGGGEKVENEPPYWEKRRRQETVIQLFSFFSFLGCGAD